MELGSTSSGLLRTKISLKGSQSQLSLVSPFYGIKPELPPPSHLIGSEDLLSRFELSGAYNRFCGLKKPREDLASFLPHVCGASHINKKADSQCSLRKLIEDPPIMTREINNLTASQMVGFKLTPGPIPDGNRFFDLEDATSAANPDLFAQTSAPGFSFMEEIADDKRQRKRIKRSLDEPEDNERRIKKQKGEDRVEKEKKKKKKKEKKKKEKKSAEEDAKRPHKKESAQPFY